MPRWARAVGLAAGAILLFAAAWLRVTSLETLREPNGDEAWYGVQAGRLLLGEPFAWRTPNGNPLNPLHLAPQVALQAIYGPRLWILRWPSVVGGLALIGLTYALGRRWLDRPTALIAAGLAAVLPTTVHHARMGNDCAQLPLYATLVLGAAGLGRWWLAAGAFALVLLAHSTGVFLLPVVAALVAARAMGAGRPIGWRRAWAPLGSMAGMAGAMAWYAAHRPVVANLYKYKGFGEHDGGSYLRGLARVFLGTAGEAAAGAQVAAFWSAAAALVGVGAWRLARQGAWERLALVAGTAASAAALFAVTGSGGLNEAIRYGLFLVAPATLSAACLARACLIEPTGAARAIGRGVQVAGLIAAGFACLLVYKANFLDSVGSVAAPAGAGPVGTALALRPAPGFDAIGTLGADIPNPDRVVLRTIAEDRRRRGASAGGAIRVVAGSWWTDWPLRYLCLRRPGVAFLAYEAMRDAGEPADARVAELLRGGAYAVGLAGSDFERGIAAAFAPGELRRWTVPKHDGRGTVVIYRLADDAGRRGLAVAR
jgi:hypothetical protein